MADVQGVVTTGVAHIVDMATGLIQGYRVNLPGGRHVDYASNARLVDITAAEALYPTEAMTSDTAATFRVAATGARYISNGSTLVEITGAGTSAVVALDGGGYGLVMPNGVDPFPMTILTGTPVEPKVAGVVQQVVTIDAGSDIDHPEILLTFNCATAGDLEAADEAIMSQRFANPDSNAEVIKTGITGDFGGGDFPAYEVPLTLLHIALRGEATYTTAAGATATVGEAVLMTWGLDDDIAAVEIRIGTSTIGGGTNWRYRQITVTGYART